MKKYKNIIKSTAMTAILSMTLMATGCGQGAGSSAGAVNNPTGRPVSVNQPSGRVGQNNSGTADAVDISELVISTMTISLYDGYNYATAEAINSYGEMTLPEYVITPDDVQVNMMQEALAKSTVYVDDHNYECNCAFALLDNYKIIINGEMELYCGEDNTLWMQEPYAVYEAEEFNNTVRQIVTDYMNDNAYIHPLECGIDFIIHNGNSIEVTDDVVGTLNKYTFSRVEIDTDFNEYGTITDVLSLSDGNVLLLYEEMGNFGYLDGADYGYYVKIGRSSSDYMAQYLMTVYENRSNGFGAVNIDSQVTISYDGNEYEADAELAELINAQSKEFSYSQYNWLTRDYDFEDSVCVIIDNGYYRIPVEIYYGNRYYIAADGEVYLTGNFSSDVEKRIFEITGIER